MGATEETRQVLAAKFQAVFPHLDERQRRLVMGAEARSLGHGGIRLVARAAGVREATVSLGAAELDSGAEPLGRVRRPGGGRKRAADLDPGLLPALLALVEPDERGDPMSPLRWTTKSTRNLADELTRQGLCGHSRGPAAGGGVQPAGQRHDHRGQAAPGPGRAVPVHQRAGQGPSGHRGPRGQRGYQETELVGEFANAGREWCPSRPAATRTHDPRGQRGQGHPLRGL